MGAGHLLTAISGPCGHGRAGRREGLCSTLATEETAAQKREKGPADAVRLESAAMRAGIPPPSYDPLLVLCPMAPSPHPMHPACLLFFSSLLIAKS